MLGHGIERIKWPAREPPLVLLPDSSTTASRQPLREAAHEFEHLVGVILDPDSPVDFASHARLVDHEGAPFNPHVLSAIQLFLLVDSVLGGRLRLSVA